MDSTATAAAASSTPASKTPFMDGLSQLADASPVLRAAEDAMPGGALIVCILATASAAVILHSWFSETAQLSAASGSRASDDKSNNDTETRRRDADTMLAIEPDGSKDKSDRAWKRELHPLIYASLRQGETDPPNLAMEDGGMDDMLIVEDGVFACAGCGTPLYDNDFRFEAGAGWPCFFTCLPNAVRERRDADDVRMELVCNACNGHLGHIFRNEGWRLPPPAERHCVNSRSLVFQQGQAADLEELDVD